MATIAQVETSEQIATVRDLWREYTTWAIAQLDLEKGGLPPTFEGLEEELAGLPGLYAPPDGRLLLATHDGQPAGTVALKRHSAGEAELKRLYVRPGFRGHRIGVLLVEALLAQAREAGYQKIILDSHINMKAAHAIYMAHGFKVVPAPADFPVALKPIVVFMECDLSA